MSDAQPLSQHRRRPSTISSITRDIVVIGGSAGGLEVVSATLASLAAEFPASVFIALHRMRDPRPNYSLSELLQKGSRLPVCTPEDEQRIESGRVYVAPTDRHVVLQNGLIRIEQSPTEHFARPSIDSLFRSAASTYGRRVIGVLVSGASAVDGPGGLWQIKQRGGLAIAQDPAEARFSALPQGAVDGMAIDFVLPAAQIAPKLTELVSARSDTAPAATASRILIVEDESIVATNLQHSLTEMGYRVVDWVPTGEAAIELAGHELPDLVLMDIHLAGALSGIEAARRIWQQLQIPIVYCTAHADLKTLKEVQTTESYGYVMKPFQSAAVRAAVELALARREKELR